MNNLHEDEINLLDCWKVLVQSRQLIGSVVGASFLLSLLVSLLLPKLYAATARILPPQQQEGLSGLAIASRLPSGFGDITTGLLGANKSAEVWAGILKSHTVADAIIHRFQLKSRYQGKTIEDARKSLEKHVEIQKSREGILTITVEDKDPNVAAQMATAFVEELDQVNRNVVMSAGKRMRIFLEGRLREAKKDLSQAEDSVRAFQKQSRAIKLDAQSQAIIEAIGSVKGTLMAKEVELNTLLSYATPTNPKVEIVKTQVDELQERLKELEEGKPGRTNPHQKDIFIPTGKFPDLSLQYVRLLRETKVQETLYELLTQQYEMARIQEVKDSPTIEVLDVAKVPEKKSKPRRALIVLLSTLTATFAAVFLAFAVRLKEDSLPG